MAVDRLNNDLYVAGNIACRTLSIPASTIVDASVAAGASIAASKLNSRQAVQYSEAAATTATAKTVRLYTGFNTLGTILSCKVGLAAVPSPSGTFGNYTVTFTILKNGVSLGANTLDNTKTNQAAYEVSLSTQTFTAGDRIELQVSVSGSVGTQGTGAFCTFVFSETPN